MVQLSRKRSVRKNNHSKIISRLANALCPKLGKLSKKVTIQNLIGWCDLTHQSTVCAWANQQWFVQQGQSPKSQSEVQTKQTNKKLISTHLCLNTHSAVQAKRCAQETPLEVSCLLRLTKKETTLALSQCANLELKLRSYFLWQNFFIGECRCREGKNTYIPRAPMKKLLTYTKEYPRKFISFGIQQRVTSKNF